MAYTVKVDIAAPIGSVWKAWTRAEETQKWLAPKAVIEFKPGGAYEFFWNEDPRIDSTLGCKLLRLQPERGLIFEWQGKEEFLSMFLPPEGTRTIIKVIFSANQMRTSVTVEQEETRDLPNWEAYDSWMSGAWNMALASLKGHCEGRKQLPYWESSPRTDQSL